jgi:hypothetical protein
MSLAARDICLSSQPVFFSQITLTNRIYLYKIPRTDEDGRANLSDMGGTKGLCYNFFYPSTDNSAGF